MRAPRGDGRRIEVQGGERRRVVDVAAIDKIHCQNGLGRKVPIDLRHGQCRVVAKEARELFDRPPLTGEIQFAADRAGEMVDQPDGIENVRLGNVPLDQNCQLRHQGQIPLDLADGVGPPNFDRQRAAVVTLRRVDLRQRPGG